MATMIRAEVSTKNKYWIDKHRHYELKHFCLQYPQWKEEYALYSDPSLPTAVVDRMPSGNVPGNPTERAAMRRAYYQDRIELIERSAKQADAYLYDYIIKAVTEGVSYTYLRAMMRIPCGKDMFYDRYRRFFWILSEARN